MMSKLPTKPTSITNETSMDRMRMKVLFSTMLDDEIDRLELFAVEYWVILSMMLKVNLATRMRQRERDPYVSSAEETRVMILEKATTYMKRVSVSMRLAPFPLIYLLLIRKTSLQAHYRSS